MAPPVAQGHTRTARAQRTALPSPPARGGDSKDGCAETGAKQGRRRARRLSVADCCPLPRRQRYACCGCLTPFSGPGVPPSVAADSGSPRPGARGGRDASATRRQRPAASPGGRSGAVPAAVNRAAQAVQSRPRRRQSETLWGRRSRRPCGVRVGSGPGHSPGPDQPASELGPHVAESVKSFRQT